MYVIYLDTTNEPLIDFEDGYYCPIEFLIDLGN